MKFTQKMMAVFAAAAVLLAEGVPACAVPGSPANTTVNAKKILVVQQNVWQRLLHRRRKLIRL